MLRTESRDLAQRTRPVGANAHVQRALQVGRTQRADQLEQSTPSESARPVSATQSFRSKMKAAAQRFKSAAVKGSVIAILAGAMAAPAMAQTSVGPNTPLNPVSVRVQQQKTLGDNAAELTRLRAGHDLRAHQQRAGVTYPFINQITLPSSAGPEMTAEANEALWRMISIAAQEVEGTPDLTNIIPTSRVKSELMWSPRIKDAAGKEFDVLSRLLPQLAKADGSLNMDQLMALFSRVNNPAPSASTDGVFLAENSGFKNGRAGYFTLNELNPEPLQPHSASGVLGLPQLVLDVNGHKTVYTIGAFCYKGGGPSFKPDANGGYSYGYSADRQKTPLNMNAKRPIYSGNTSFGLFGYEANAPANENGWKLLDHGAYAGVSIMEMKLGELVDYQLDALGKPVGEPTAISVEQLKKDGRLAQDLTPSLLWRAFETEYRLSAFKSPTHGVAVLDQLTQLFARDAVFDLMANDAGTWTRWSAESAKVNAGGSDAVMKQMWKQAIQDLNAEITGGKHFLKTPLSVDDDGVASISREDYVRTAIQRSARNMLVLHKLNLHHGSIAAGGDNLNAAWQMVDLDHLDAAYAGASNDPRTQSNLRDFTTNLQEMVDDLKDRVPEFKKFDGQFEDLLKQEIDRQAPIYGKPAAAAQPGQG